jgi:hypothetical protein
MALVFRADLGGLGEMRRAPEPDTEIVVAWIRLLVRNVELLIAWLVLWVFLHVGGIIVAGFVLGPGHGGPVSILIPLEVIPGFFVGLSVARLTLAQVQIQRVGRAVGAARKVAQPPPTWTQRGGLLVLLATPSDWDFLVVLAIVVILEVQPRTG